MNMFNCSTKAVKLYIIRQTDSRTHIFEKISSNLDDLACFYFINPATETDAVWDSVLAP